MDFTEEYVDGWRAAHAEMRRPDWQAVLEETRRDVAAGRGRPLEAILEERRRRGGDEADDE